MNTLHCAPVPTLTATEASRSATAPAYEHCRSPEATETGTADGRPMACAISGRSRPPGRQDRTTSGNSDGPRSSRRTRSSFQAPPITSNTPQPAALVGSVTARVPVSRATRSSGAVPACAAAGSSPACCSQNSSGTVNPCATGQPESAKRGRSPRGVMAPPRSATRSSQVLPPLSPAAGSAVRRSCQPMYGPMRGPSPASNWQPFCCPVTPIASTGAPSHASPAHRTVSESMRSNSHSDRPRVRSAAVVRSASLERVVTAVTARAAVSITTAVMLVEPRSSPR